MCCAIFWHLNLSLPCSTWEDHTEGSSCEEYTYHSLYNYSEYSNVFLTYMAEAQWGTHIILQQIASKWWPWKGPREWKEHVFMHTGLGSSACWAGLQPSAPHRKAVCAPLYHWRGILYDMAGKSWGLFMTSSNVLWYSRAQTGRQVRIYTAPLRAVILEPLRWQWYTARNAGQQASGDEGAMWKIFIDEDSQEAGGSLFSFNNYLPEKVETKASSIQVSPKYILQLFQRCTFNL